MRQYVDGVAHCGLDARRMAPATESLGGLQPVGRCFLLPQGLPAHRCVEDPADRGAVRIEREPIPPGPQRASGSCDDGLRLFEVVQHPVRDGTVERSVGDWEGFRIGEHKGNAVGHASVERLLTCLIEERSGQVDRDDAVSALRERNGHPAGSGSDVGDTRSGGAPRPAADRERIERLIERRIDDIPLVALCLVRKERCCRCL